VIWVRPWRGVLLFGILFVALWSGPSSAQERVDLELVLAVDVSGSVDGEEFALQMGGIAQAFRDPGVIQAIENATPRGLAVAVVLWSSSEWQHVSVDWWRVANRADARAFAAAVDAAPREFAGNTAIASAIDFSVRQFDGNGFEGARRVIDVSGDGISNDGPDTAPARDNAVEQGVTVNGLVIVENNLPARKFYREEVIGGPGAFTMNARGFADFGRVFKRKLLKEISGPGIS
jgi:hypothetical protein